MIRTRRCGNPSCDRMTPPTPVGQYKPFRYCKECGAERTRAIARQNMRRRRGTIPPAKPRDSWWTSTAPVGFTAQAEARIGSMAQGKGSAIASQMEVVRGEG